jgi:hypothetical protein
MKDNNMKIEIKIELQRLIKALEEEVTCFEYDIQNIDPFTLDEGITTDLNDFINKNESEIPEELCSELRWWITSIENFTNYFNKAVSEYEYLEQSFDLEEYETENNLQLAE